MKKFIYAFFGIFVLGFMSPAFVYAETININLPDKVMKTPTTEQNKDVEAAIQAFKDKTDDNIIGSEVAIKKDISISGNKNLSAAYSAWKKKCKEKQQTVTNVKKWKSVDAGFQSGNKNKYYCQVDLCEDGYDPSKDKKSCISKDTTCTSMDKNIKTAHYDKTTKTCVIDICQDDYGVKDNKCVSKKKLARQETRANNKLEKEYAADIKSLVDAFNTVVTKITTACEADGGKIVNGECNKQTKTE